MDASQPRPNARRPGRLRPHRPPEFVARGLDGCGDLVGTVSKLPEALLFPAFQRNRTLVAAKFFRKWWPETGSNRRRRPFQGRALPLSYLALAMQFPPGCQERRPVVVSKIACLKWGRDQAAHRSLQNVDPQYSNAHPPPPNLAPTKARNS